MHRIAVIESCGITRCGFVDGISHEEREMEEFLFGKNIVASKSQWEDIEEAVQVIDELSCLLLLLTSWTIVSFRWTRPQQQRLSMTIW